MDEGSAPQSTRSSRQRTTPFRPRPQCHRLAVRLTRVQMCAACHLRRALERRAHLPAPRGTSARGHGSAATGRRTSRWRGQLSAAGPGRNTCIRIRSTCRGPSGFMRCHDRTAFPRRLSGVRVADLTSQLSGPYSIWLLAPLSADVVKVERPGGDPRRGNRALHRGREPLLNERQPRQAQASCSSFSRRRVRRTSRRASGWATCSSRTCAGRPGATGFSAARIAELNPRLVFASISGF